MKQGSTAYVKSATERSTLFVGNVPHEMNEQELKEAITQMVGPITSIELKTGPPPQYLSRGFCFISFSDKQSADNARKILTNTPLRVCNCICFLVNGKLTFS